MKLAATFDQITVLRGWCARWDGLLIEISQVKFDRLFQWRTCHQFRRHEFSEAPFTDRHGVNYDRKHVYFVTGCGNVNAIIHEMGHVFASARGWRSKRACTGNGRVTTRTTASVVSATSGAGPRPSVRPRRSVNPSRRESTQGSSRPGR